MIHNYIYQSCFQQTLLICNFTKEWFRIGLKLITKKFNSSKFNYVCYHTKNSPNNGNIYISPTHDIIKLVTTVKDLGVTMSNSCDFNAHIDKTVKICSRLIGWILRTTTTRDSTTMLILFKSIVLPILEYA